MKLIIEDDEGRKTVVPIVREEIEISIGRHEDNTIRLTERNVSRKHAKLIRKNGSVWVEDLGSYNGVRVNGDRIQGRVQVNEGDLIQIGDYDLAIQRDGASKVEAVPSPSHASDSDVALEQTAPHGVPGEPATHEEAPPKRAEPTAVIHVDQVPRTKREVLDIAPESAPRLVLATTELAGREYACIRTVITVGRGDDNDIAIDHRSLSRNHCKVFREEDGTWKVVDLKSANGVKVNGEAYAEAPLRFGDVVDLGHVRLQFVAPGEEANLEVAVAPRRPRRPSLRLVFVLAGGAFVVGGAGALFFLLRTTPGPTPPPTVAPAPGARQAPPAAPAVKPPTGPAAKPPSPAPQLPAKEAGRDAYEAGIALLKARRFADAAKELARANEAALPEAAGPLSEAIAEDEAQRTVSDARDKLEKKEWEAARQAAGRVPDRSSFAAEAKKISEKADRELKRLAAAAVKPTDRGTPRPPPKPPGPDVTKDEAFKSLLNQANDLYRNQQPKQAAVMFERALKLDPSALYVHKYLGACLAATKDMDRAAQHYKKYLAAYPNASDAPALRENLKAYEESVKRSTGEESKDGDN